MNLSHPILICDQNEDFRSLLRDMLTKNGFFHILEADNQEEALEILEGKTDLLVLIGAESMKENFEHRLSLQKNFIVFANNKSPKTYKLATQVGIEHLMAYPLSSKKLVKKLNEILH